LDLPIGHGPGGFAIFEPAALAEFSDQVLQSCFERSKTSW
jgi:hypothetical protein